MLARGAARAANTPRRLFAVWPGKVDKNVNAVCLDTVPDNGVVHTGESGSVLRQCLQPIRDSIPKIVVRVGEQLNSSTVMVGKSCSIKLLTACWRKSPDI